MVQPRAKNLIHQQMNIKANQVLYQISHRDIKSVVQLGMVFAELPVISLFDLKPFLLLLTSGYIVKLAVEKILPIV